MEVRTLIAVIWDMDGVLVDTAEIHYETWIETLGEEGIPFDRETFRRTFGMNNRKVLTLLLGREPDEGEFRRIAGRKEARFREAVRGQVQPLPGVRALLEQNRARGFCQAVASSAPMENIEVLLEEMDILKYFDVIVSGANLPGKPDPAVFLEAARRLDASPEHCVVIEDSIAGVAGAKAAGMQCAAVLTTNPAEALKQADLIVESLDKLPGDWVEVLFPGLEKVREC